MQSVALPKPTKKVVKLSINKNVNDVALIRHLATSNIANFMWSNFLLVKKYKFDAPGRD